MYEESNIGGFDKIEVLYIFNFPLTSKRFKYLC